MSFTPRAIEDAEPLLEINTTPLIDVMLVLLIMFIITLPVQLHAVNLQASAAATPAPPEKPRVVNIEIHADNTLWWNGQAVADKAALGLNLATLPGLAATPQQPPQMQIKAHPQSKYGTVAMVLASVQRYGFSNINVVEWSEP
jgi:biopolymer transport protein ExbD